MEMEHKSYLCIDMTNNLMLLKKIHLMLKRKKKEYNIYGRIVLKFNDDYTLAHRGDSVQLKDTFTKKKKEQVL